MGFYDVMFGVPGMENSNLPIVGGMFDDPAEEAHAAQMRSVAEGLGLYRGPMAQSQSNAINQSLGALAPANTMMGMMYGPQMQMDFDAMSASPLVPGQTAIGPEPPPEEEPGWSPMAEGYAADPLQGRGYPTATPQRRG